MTFGLTWEGHCQCDQIWRNYSTCDFKKYSMIFIRVYLIILNLLWQFNAIEHIFMLVYDLILSTLLFQRTLTLEVGTVYCRSTLRFEVTT